MEDGGKDSGERVGCGCVGGEASGISRPDLRVLQCLIRRSAGGDLTPEALLELQLKEEIGNVFVAQVLGNKTKGGGPVDHAREYLQTDVLLRIFEEVSPEVTAKILGVIEEFREQLKGAFDFDPLG